MQFLTLKFEMKCIIHDMLLYVRVRLQYVYKIFYDLFCYFCMLKLLEKLDAKRFVEDSVSYKK